MSVLTDFDGQAGLIPTVVASSRLARGRRLFVRQRAAAQDLLWTSEARIESRI